MKFEIIAVPLWWPFLGETDQNLHSGSILNIFSWLVWVDKNCTGECFRFLGPIFVCDTGHEMYQICSVHCNTRISELPLYFIWSSGVDKRLKLNDSKTEMDRKQKQIYNGNLIWIFIIYHSGILNIIYSFIYLSTFFMNNITYNTRPIAYICVYNSPWQVFDEYISIWI